MHIGRTVFPLLSFCVGELWGIQKTYTAEVTNRSARVVINSSYDAPADALKQRLSGQISLKS